MSVTNSLFFENLGGAQANSCAGTLVSGGGNLLDTAAADCPSLVATGDRAAVTGFFLGPLQVNGGPTKSFALETGSAAIGAAVAKQCPDTDQRGYPRSPPRPCDVGAFQTQPPGPPGPR